MNTLAADLLEVNPAAPTVDVKAARLEAEYREYDAWLAANADQLAADAEDYDRYESGCYAW